MKKILVILLTVLTTNILKAQDSLKVDNGFLYRFTMGMGFGSGPTSEDRYGIGFNADFAIQQQSNIYSVGYRRIEVFEIFGGSSPTVSNNSFDIFYGKVLTRGPIFTSIHAGIGVLEGIRQGEYLYGGGWLGGGYYEKIKFYTIEFPASFKILLVPKKSHSVIKEIDGGVGLELFANINSNNSFWGINFCFQFGKLKPKK